MYQIETSKQYPSLVMIADDFTGALDTGVKFSKSGIKVSVVPHHQAIFAPDTDVLVINADSRHLPEQEAYDRIRDICAAWQEIPNIYLKFDSALRGPIGSSIQAAMDTLHVQLSTFVPAYPEMGRTTVDGRQLINGIPLNRTAFAEDHLNPVTIDEIAELFAKTSIHAVHMGKIALPDMNGDSRVAIYDAQTREDLNDIAHVLHDHRMLRLTAGCAGFAQALAGVLGFDQEILSHEQTCKPLIVFCGSLNAVTRQQVKHCIAEGFVPFEIHPQWSKDDRLWWECVGASLQDKKNLVIFTSHEQFLSMDVESMQSMLGETLSQLTELAAVQSYTVMVIGGDTLMGFLQTERFPEIRILSEVVPGVVMFEMYVHGRNMRFLSKSGGFGAPELLGKLVKERM